MASIDGGAAEEITAVLRGVGGLHRLFKQLLVSVA